MTQPWTRRTWLHAAWTVPLSASLRSESRADSPRKRMLDLIEAPNNLGLRPPTAGREPGTWRAPVVLDGAGLSARLQPARHVRLARPTYVVQAVPGTRIRNGTALRAFSLALASEVERSLRRGAMPVVIGGDCSTLLGCMVGLRHTGGRGLVHIDGHSDFFYPGNYDTAAHLGAAAGMDLALATGRGEPVLTAWPGVSGPLVADADAIQIGERNDISAYRGLSETAIERIAIQKLQAAGLGPTMDRVLRRLRDRSLDRAWLHIDLDVLDESVMTAVDSPGTPGLGVEELATAVQRLVRSGRIAGLDVAIYDPDLDPDGKHAARIVACIAAMLDASG
jgi:arginase